MLPPQLPVVHLKFIKALRSKRRSCATADGSKERSVFLNRLAQAKACSARLKSCPDTRLVLAKSIFPQAVNFLRLRSGQAVPDAYLTK